MSHLCLYSFQAVTTDFGLEVLWDGKHGAEIAVPIEYKGALCGLCGMYSVELNTFIVTNSKGRMRVGSSKHLFLDHYLY